MCAIRDVWCRYLNISAVTYEISGRQEVIKTDRALTLYCSKLVKGTRVCFIS